MLAPDSSSRPTVRDVARAAGVSTATVSRVMNDSGNVSNSIRSRVLSAIATLDYSPNTVAAQLSRNGGQPRKRTARSPQPSPGKPPTERDPRNKRARQSLKLENRELKRVIKSLAREVIRWKTLANSP